MNRETKKRLWLGGGLLAAFALWTAMVCRIDVQAIGPQGSMVGLATLNRFVHNLTGVHLSLYTITDWLSLVPLGFVMGFGLLGLTQWLRRGKLKLVDRDILILGGYYVIVMAAYILFEMVVVNYRPVLMEGYLEASYPSSTTMLVLCVMPTAGMQLNRRIRNPVLRKWAAFALNAFTLFMVAGRLMAGVHWFSDIVGGILLSGGLVTLYRTMAGISP